jgi:hypothetical protein
VVRSGSRERVPLRGQAIETIKETSIHVTGKWPPPDHHGDYRFLVASGHVCAGKTRIGLEVKTVLKDVYGY